MTLQDIQRIALLVSGRFIALIWGLYAARNCAGIRTGAEWICESPVWEQSGNVEKIGWRAADLAGLREIAVIRRTIVSVSPAQVVVRRVCSQRFKTS